MAGIRLTKFGGMLPLETPENLGKHMAVLAENTDLSRHTLRPWRKPRKTSSNTGRFLYKESCCEIVSDNCEASIADTQINCRLVIATGIKPYPAIATHKQACAEQWCRLGFPCDLIAPIATGGISSLPVEGSTKSQLRSYSYRLKNKFGQYSAPSYPSNTLQLDSQNTVTITLPTSFDADYCITDIEVFTTETTADILGNNSLSDWFSIGTVTVGTATFTDAYNDLGEMLDSQDYEPPPSDLRDVQYWRSGQLVGLSGNLIVFSAKNRFQSWPAAARHAIHDTPQALLVGSKVGFVATDGRPALIQLDSNCNDKTCHRVEDDLTSDPHPIVSKRSAIVHNDHGIWATKDGLLMIAPNGATKLLTAKFYTQDQWRALKPETMIGAVHDGVYYAFTDEIGFRLHLPDNTYASTNDTELTTLKFEQGNPTALYRSFTDEFYLQFADGVYWWNEGTDFMTLRWHGAVFDLPAITSMTAYKVVHDHADVQVNHWLDDERIDSELVQSIRPHRLPIASGLNWQVELETIGEIKEYHLATSVRDLSEGVA
jgi:hypothetical protein